MNELKQVFILRALPGSGKTSLAEIITNHHPSATIISIDKFFYDKDGHYNYNGDSTVIKEKIALATQEYNKALSTGVGLIVIDCVNETKRHVDDWKIPAEKSGYRVTVLEIPHADPTILALRNRHGATKERIQKKLLRWEYIGFDMPLRRIFRKLKDSLSSRTHLGKEKASAKLQKPFYF